MEVVHGEVFGGGFVHGRRGKRGVERRWNEAAQAAEQAIKSAGGKLEAFYFAFGDSDAFVIVDAPDHATIAAASLAISASGAVRTKTVVLLTPEEIDQASKKGATYQPPGH